MRRHLAESVSWCVRRGTLLMARRHRRTDGSPP